ncbi:MAG: hypothetical protein R3B06_24750 [Kofleriaceae bacterium]
MNPLRNGTLIALTAAGLFAGACSKKAETESQPAAKTNPAPAGDMAKDKAGAMANTAPAAPDQEMAAKVHCEGVNACKGHGACKTAANACAGQNGCKGQGFVEMPAAECTAKGGKVAAM